MATQAIRHTLHASRPRSAFTLVELMAVIAIIGLMMLVVVPSIQGNKGSLLISGARQFSNDLNLARQTAIARNWGVRVVIATDKTMRDCATDLPEWLSMQYSAYAILYQQRLSTAWAQTAGFANEPNLPLGRDRWYYIQDWKFLPKGVIFDPAPADLTSTDGKGKPLPMTTPFFGPMSTHDLWDGVTRDKLPFPYRNGDSDPPRGSEMAFIEFRPNGRPTMAGSVRLINASVMVSRGSGGTTVTVTVPGRTSPTNTGANDPACQNCVVLSWDGLIGKIKWTQPGT